MSKESLIGRLEALKHGDEVGVYTIVVDKCIIVKEFMENPSPGALGVGEVATETASAASLVGDKSATTNEAHACDASIHLHEPWLEIIEEDAKGDDWHLRIVGSDIRQLCKLVRLFQKEAIKQQAGECIQTTPVCNHRDEGCIQTSETSDIRERTEIEFWKVFHAHGDIPFNDAVRLAIRSALSLRSPMPVVVSLERCAMEAARWMNCVEVGFSNWDDLTPRAKDAYRDQAKAVLNAAGVKYVD
jgi:hypothetical protein